MSEHVNDHYVKEAIKHGFRSRAAFKLIEMQKKYKIIKPNHKVLDLGAAPGGWTQVAVKYSQGESKNEQQKLKNKQGKVISNILAIDRDSMNPVEGSFFYQGDLLEEKTRLFIPEYFDMEPVDVCMSDMAPNFSGDLDIDHHNINALNNICLSLSQQNLKPGGTLLMKTLQGKFENDFFKQYKKYFKEFLRVKPGASRSRSSEIYYLGKGFKMSQDYFIQKKFQKKIEEKSNDIITEEEMSIEEQAKLKKLTVEFLNKQIRLGNKLDSQTIQELQEMEFLHDYNKWEELKQGKRNAAEEDKQMTEREQFLQVQADATSIFGENALSYNQKKPDFFDELDNYEQAVEKVDQQEEEELLMQKQGRKKAHKDEALFMPGDELNPEEDRKTKLDLHDRFEKFFGNTKDEHQYISDTKEEENINKIISNGGQETDLENFMNQGSLDMLKDKVLNIEKLQEIQNIKQEEFDREVYGESQSVTNLDDFLSKGNVEGFTEEQMTAIWKEYEECKEVQERYQTQSVQEFMELRQKKGSYKANQQRVDEFEKLFKMDDFFDSIKNTSK